MLTDLHRALTSVITNPARQSTLAFTWRFRKVTRDHRTISQIQEYLYCTHSLASKRAPPPLRPGIPIHSGKRLAVAHTLCSFGHRLVDCHHQLESLVPHCTLSYLLRYTSIPNAQVLFNQLDSGFTQLTEPVWKGIWTKPPHATNTGSTEITHTKLN